MQLKKTYGQKIIQDENCLQQFIIANFVEVSSRGKVRISSF